MEREGKGLGKVGYEESVSRWIEGRAAEKDAPSLTWLLKQAVKAVIECYPPGQGADIVWAVVRLAEGGRL